MQLGLGDLDIPVAEIIPEETVQGLYGSAELEGGEALLDLGCDLEQAIEDGMIVGVELGRLETPENGTQLGVVGHVAAHLPEA